jgi:hypothetical protein
VGRPAGPRLKALVFAAEDLLEGVRHDGPRAFSQTHYEHTKARADIAKLLLAAGVEEGTLVALGLVRSKYLGLSSVGVSVSGIGVPLDALRGPVLIRCDQSGLGLRLGGAARALAVVENLQAAEAVSDRLHGLAVVYTAGLLSASALRLIGELAQAAPSVAVIPDADLGGVRIAEQVLSVASRASVIDIGEQPHPARDPFQPGGFAERGLRAALGGPATGLASAVLRRGYPVEQELATVTAVRQWVEGIA